RAVPDCDSWPGPGTSRLRRRPSRNRPPPRPPAARARAVRGRQREAGRSLRVSLFQYTAPEMVQKCLTAADGELVAHGAGHIALPAFGGIRKGTTERETRRHRSRERAPGSVRARRVDARRAEFQEAVAVEQQVDDVQ